MRHFTRFVVYHKAANKVFHYRRSFGRSLHKQVLGKYPLFLFGQKEIGFTESGVCSQLKKT